jgi:2-aminobenzoylacetyl-CoA thioesterase
MRVRKTGRVCEGIWYLGREESGVYVLEGERESMVVSGGMGHIAPDVLRQMTEFGIDQGRIRKLLILHAHFDHVGAVAFLKRTLPWLDVYGSARARELLETPKVIETINAFSRASTKRLGMTDACSSFDLDWRDDVPVRVVSDGDRLDLGGLAVEILETPGHSSCSVSAYVPSLKALFPSDGGGIPLKDTIVTSGNSDYTQYQASLERLRRLDVAYYCADHYGFITGAEAARFIPDTIEAAHRFRAAVEDAVRRTGDVDAAARELNQAFYGVHPDYLLPPEIFEGVFRQIVRHIAGRILSSWGSSPNPER